MNHLCLAATPYLTSSPNIISMSNIDSIQHDLPASRLDDFLSHSASMADLDLRDGCQNKSFITASSGSSLLSSPPDSDDFNELGSRIRDRSLTSALKRKFDDLDDSLDYEAPTTRAAARRRISGEKKHNVCFTKRATKRKIKNFQCDSTATSTKISSPGAKSGVLSGRTASTERQNLPRQDGSARRHTRQEILTNNEASQAQDVEKGSTKMAPSYEITRISNPLFFESNITPSKRGRGGGPGRRGRGRSWRGRGGGRPGSSRDDDGSPDRSGQRALNESEEKVVGRLKARQAELKTFFNEVALQQKAYLTQLALRDVEELSNGKKTYWQVPEHQRLLDDLRRTRLEAEDLVVKKSIYQYAEAQNLIDAQKEATHHRCKVRKTHSQEAFTLPSQLSFMNTNRPFLDTLYGGKVRASCWSTSRLPCSQGDRAYSIGFGSNPAAVS